MTRGAAELPRAATAPRRRPAGFSYVETLVATLLVAVALVPALESLGTGTVAVGVDERATAVEYRAAGRMEELLAQRFAALDAAAAAAGSPSTPSSFSDPAGTVDRRLVYLARYDADDADADADPFTGGDEGILWVRVAVEGSNVALETLRRW